MKHVDFKTYLANAPRPLILDGGMGTVLQSYNLTAADFGDASHAGCFEYLAIAHPRPVRQAHAAYLAAGADILETCTFGASPMVLQEFGLSEQAYQINLANARLAKSLAVEASTIRHPRWVAGSLGPTTKSLSLQHLSFAAMVDNYRPQAAGLIDGGVDYLLLETANDPLTLQAAREAVRQICQEKQIPPFPLAISATFAGTQMLAGQDIAAWWAIAEAWHPLYLGLNCITQTELPLLNFLLRHATIPVAVMPNNGLPDAHGLYPQTPAKFVESLKPYLAQGLKLVGGCCGTTPQHIAELAQYVQTSPPQNSAPPKIRPSVLAGTSMLNLDQKKDGQIIIAGERANVLGAKSFREAVQKKDWIAATEIAKSQIKQGAQILDLCFAHPEGHEAQDCQNFLKHAAALLKVPLMIDSINLPVIKAALQRIPGKCLINSANLEHGIPHLQEFVAVAQQFGAALVVGTIDQSGMALEAATKLQIATNLMDVLQEMNFPAEDVYFDPLVFPCASGDEKYRGKAWATIDALKLIKEKFPRSKTILGISNVSFGLPANARKILNAVFLHHAALAGLDVAIANPLQLLPITQIDAALQDASTALLQGKISAQTFADNFREAHVKTPQVTASANLSLPAKIQLRLQEGTQTGLKEDLAALRQTMDALSIINQVLLPGMQIVGQLFDQQKLIIAEVLQAAQVMKAAVDYLKPFLPAQQSTTKATILLATVKGDVHDIGKNLVDIILSNNGFKVIDLGIKVPSETIIKAYQQYHPDYIALSGLLVKSAYQMAEMAQDFTKAGITVPLLVGGAALSEKFTQENIAPNYGGRVYYNKDAMHGLMVAEELWRNRPPAAAPQTAGASAPTPAAVIHQTPLPKVPAPPALSFVPAPDYDLHQTTMAIWELASLVHPIFYTRHLGLKLALAEQIVQEKNFPRQLPPALAEVVGPKYFPLLQALHEVLLQYADTHLTAKALYRFAPCYAEGDQIVLLDPHNQQKIFGKWELTRQIVAPHHCLSDWVRPQDFGPPPDNVACMVTTVGQNIRAAVQKLKEQGEFLKSHLLAAYALESAQAYAEFLHQKIRQLWQIAPTQGQRFSFGHASCPNLENQKLLFAYLQPAQIGVSLTEELMMDPEASVSAIVLHHPQAQYFDALKTE